MLSNLNTPFNQTFQRLASGYQINSAADDAAGLQISNRLTSQINGINQGIRNANDGISLSQIAEGALDEMTTAIQRMRTLVIQSRSGINSQQDRTALQNEIRQINKEITRIAETTSFAGIPLLDGRLNRDFLVGANAGENINVNLERDEGWTAEGLRLSEVVVDGSDGVNNPTQNGSPITPGYVIQAPFPAVLGTISGLEVRINGNEFRPMPDVVFSSTDPGVNAFNFAVAMQSTDISLVIAQGDNFSLGDQLFLLAGSIEFRISGVATDEATAQANRALISSLTGIPESFFGEQAYNLFPPEDEDSITQFNLKIIDEALSTIDSARAKLGATQNRFQATIRNLSNISENVSAARSRIRDTDYAKETAELTRLQILQQASTTVLSQANQRPQAALALLQ
ncbi:flagellin [Alishewanella sp. HH-ZS]|uniref:flagellin N-terminal helical domain-containing protein n=1 Tax=Alishewanella sp. HH-ZS TaxID=1856684 RepID=UPI00351032D1